MKKVILYITLTSMLTMSFAGEQASAGPVSPELASILEGISQVSQVVEVVAIVSVALSVGSSVSASFAAGLKEKKGAGGKRMRFQHRFHANPRAMKRDLKRLSGPEYTWLTATLLNVEPSNLKQLRCALSTQKEALNQLIDKTAYTIEKPLKKRVDELYHFIAQVTREVEAGTLQDHCKAAP